MSGRDVQDCLRDMARYAETAARLVEGMTLAQLEADERTSLALERAIEILGEAASRVPPERRALHPDLPWREMIGTRNRLAHGYFATELFILHEMTTVLLPPLVPRAAGDRSRRRCRARARPVVGRLGNVNELRAFHARRP